MLKEDSKAPDLSTVDHIISEWYQKFTFNFTEIVINQGLKGGTVFQNVLNYIYNFENVFSVWN